MLQRACEITHACTWGMDQTGPPGFLWSSSPSVTFRTEGEANAWLGVQEGGCSVPLCVGLYQAWSQLLGPYVEGATEGTVALGAMVGHRG